MRHVQEQERRYQEQVRQQKRSEASQPRRHAHPDDYQNNYHPDGYQDSYETSQHQHPRDRSKPPRAQRRQTLRELKEDKARSGQHGHRETSNTGFGNFTEGPPTHSTATRPEAKDERAVTF